MQKGFTLIEIIVVIAIVSLLTILVLPNYRAGEKQFSLQRSAYKVAQDLRRAEEMAMSAKEFVGAPDKWQGSYGIKFTKNTSIYILFADLDEDKAYDQDKDGEISILELEKGVSVSSPSLTVVFTPPDPVVAFSVSGDSASIVLNGEKTITVEKTGLIYVE